MKLPVVRHLIRKIRQPVSPAPVTQISDLASHPNDILLSYLIASNKEPLNLEGLRKLLPNSPAYASDPHFEYLPKILNKQAQITKSAEADERANALNTLRTWSAPDTHLFLLQEYQGLQIGYLATKNPISVMDPRTHGYKQVYLLTHETPANLGIDEIGLNIVDSNEIYLRENSRNWLIAKSMHLQPDMFKTKRLAKATARNLAGIFWLHELVEVDIRKQAPELTGSELEMAVWDEVKKYTVPIHWELAMTALQTKDDERGKNVANYLRDM